jgi:peptidoglycan hydrolase-like protein with peptidoglycan-binding domain
MQLAAPTAVSQTIMRAPGPLNAAQEAAAVAFNRGHFERRSVRAIQIATGTRVDGDFGDESAQGVATWQGAHGVAVNGRVDAATLNTLVLDLAAAGDHDLAIQLVEDFHDLDVTSDTLTVSYDAGLATAHNTRFESGDLRVIAVGPAAFAGADALRDAIRAALADAAPAAAPAGAALNRLTRAEQQSAMGFLRTYGDPRSIRAIQGLAGDDVSGTVDVDLVQRVADYQATNRLVIDGKVGHGTLRQMVADLVAADDHNAAIRLVIDFHDLSHQWALLDIRYDPAEGDNASTGGHLPGPSTVLVGPSGFAQGYEGLVHTIAHELEHVRQRRNGMPNRNEREFRGEEIEMLSEGMLEEDTDGFMNDARRALHNWNALPAADQRRLWPRFARATRKVRQRFDAATPAERAAHAATMAAYDAVVRP